MTCYDSSVLVDYLDGDEDAVEFVANRAEERAVAPPIVAFELYQGEVFKTGTTAFDDLEEALAWLDIVEETPAMARAAAELQDQLHQQGAALSARDAFIAGSAIELGETLAVADDDFDVDGVRDALDVAFV
ncbi:hypothetical protein GCM10028857_20720 [Salinarchaeum chitinilyticum]